MFEVVFDPARNVDTQPAEELQCPHRSAHGKCEGDRHGRDPPGGALVVVVRDQVLRGVDVIDHLGHEEAAARVLLRQEPKVFVVATAVAFGYRDAAERQGGVDLAAGRLGVPRATS